MKRGVLLMGVGGVMTLGAVAYVVFLPTAAPNRAQGASAAVTAERETLAGNAHAASQPAQPPTPVAGSRAEAAPPAAVAAPGAIAGEAGKEPVADPIGSVQPVRSDANPSVALVSAAIATRTHPERLSALVAPAPFDAAAFAAASPQERDAYVREVQPGRAFQSATPGDPTPVLAPLGATQLRMAQDGQVTLSVQSKPGYPVSFTSFDLGHFQNQLVAQTVLADDNGVASVTFFAGPGTVDAVHVLAASPAASGQVAFDIHVAMPAARTVAGN